MKVLIVDDSRAMRRLHREVLSELVEVDVVEAEDGVHAVYELQSIDFQVDLILVDWMMPRMDGLTLVRLLKSTENLRNIPILMVTSCSDERRMKEAAMKVREIMTREPRVASPQTTLQAICAHHQRPPHIVTV